MCPIQCSYGSAHPGNSELAFQVCPPKPTCVDTYSHLPVAFDRIFSLLPRGYSPVWSDARSTGRFSNTSRKLLFTVQHDWLGSAGMPEAGNSYVRSEERRV